MAPVQATQAPTLRPLGVGDVLDRTFNVYKSKPLVFIALSAIWYLVFVIAVVAGVLVFAVAVGASLARFIQSFERTGGFTGSPDDVARLFVAFIAFVLFTVAVGVLVFSIQLGALVHAAARRYLGKDASIGEAFGAGIGASPRVFVAGLVIFLAIALFWLVVFVVAAITNQALAFFVAACASIVVTFYLGASWLVAPVVIVVERTGPMAALGRAWKLAEGNRWRVIGIQALLLILNLVLSILIGAVFAIGGSPDEPNVSGLVLQNLVNFASTIIWAPVQWIAFTVLYYDLRVRKEAFDLQLAAEALPQS
jgi:hypothetical protein